MQESALFVKERADIERDYAKKLDFLSKKFQARKLKKMEKIRKQTATQGAETPASNLMDSFEFLSVGRGYFSSSCNYRTMETTCQHAWNALLKETEESAKSHEFLAEDLTSRVSDRLKKLASVKDEQRKKVAKYSQWFCLFADFLCEQTLDFLQRYFNERRRLEENVQLSKAAYYKHCDQVQIMKQKYDRLPDVKSQEKIKKYVNLEILEMNNAKVRWTLELKLNISLSPIQNLYLLAIQSSNSVQVKYFKEGIPEILGELRDQSVSLVEYAKSAFHEFLACRSGQHQGSLKRLEELDGKISAIDGVTDATASKQFEIRNYLDGLEPFEFDSSGLWKDSVSIQF